MATRAEQKARAREERIARERAAADAARRKQRLYTIAGVLVLVVVIVGVVIAIASGGSSSTSNKKSKSAVTGLLTGIPQNGNTLGKASAPVTVTAYEDLECPVCKEFTLAAENQLIAKDIRQGRAKLVFKSLQTATPNLATFELQQQAAQAAAKQNKLWNFVELFYHQQGAEGTPYVTESYLSGLAKQIPGFDVSAWQAARKAPNLAQPVNADIAQAQAKGFNSTPTIVVQGPKASPTPVSGAVDYAKLEQLVKQAGG
jgi:protein-disulfide isomerase